MPRTRSRPKTEEKFQDAVLKLIADEGCGGLGINSVAHRAGADKVLIYRYFGDFKGLLQRVAESRQWLPTASEVLQKLQGVSTHPLALLQEIESILVRHIRSDAATHQLVRWRRAGICPICEQFTKEWRVLWESLPAQLSANLSSAQGRLWAQACSLLALTIEAELCSEPVDSQCLAVIADSLEAVELELTDHVAVATTFVEESLPTNLL